jgi:hypothetical protein
MDARRAWKAHDDDFFSCSVAWNVTAFQNENFVLGALKTTQRKISKRISSGKRYSTILFEKLLVYAIP